MQTPPLPVYWDGHEDPVGYVFHVSLQSSLTELRTALDAQLDLAPFDLTGIGGFVLQAKQEQLLRVLDVWGTDPRIRLRPRATGNSRVAAFVQRLLRLVHPGLCIAVPLVAASAATFLTFLLGMFGLCFAQVTHSFVGVSGTVPTPLRDEPGGGALPTDDYQYYLYTFRKVWEATLNALVSMIQMYVNGPITILCQCLHYLMEIVSQCVLSYLQVFKDCFDTCILSLKSMINNYVSSCVTMLCGSLDVLINKVTEAVEKYLEVFENCWTVTIKPENASLFIGMATVTFGGTALIVYIVLKYKWYIARGRAVAATDQPMMLP